MRRLSFNTVLSCLLKVVFFVTSANCVTLFILPIFWPMSTFSIVRLLFLAIFEGKYGWIPVGIGICGLLLIAALSIEKNKIFAPILLLAYFIYDFANLIFLIIQRWDNTDYWTNYLFHTLLAVAFIVLLCIYCAKFFRRETKQSAKGK